MLKSVVGSKNLHTQPGTQPGRFNWRTTLFYGCVLALFVVAIGMYLYTLHQPFDRDSYDEGVYWQSLRAMSSGQRLYQQIFYSQPPFFLLSIFPIYMLAGQTIWSARLGVVVVALLGLLGAFLLGKAVRGRIGGLVALLLLMTAPFYLGEAQTLQADAPASALTLLAVGLAYMWWNHPDGIAGYCYAALTACVLVLSILSKLSAVSTLIPIVFLACAQIWRISHQPATTRRASALPLLTGILVFIVSTLLVILPFAGIFAQLWDSNVTFHTQASSILHAAHTGNRQRITEFLNTPLTYVALYSSLLALWRRDWRVIPLIIWLAGSLVLLWQQTPLFQHHLVALIPPLVGLAIMGLGPVVVAKSQSQRAYPKTEKVIRFLRDASNSSVLLVVLLLMFVAASDINTIRHYYIYIQDQGNSVTTQDNLRVARDLEIAIQPDQQVITDAQFIAAQANRSTPGPLVDTSGVRISTSYVTASILIHTAEEPQVHAVLFYTERLIGITEFHNWVSQHFQLAHTYGGNRELWVKMK